MLYFLADHFTILICLPDKVKVIAEDICILYDSLNKVVKFVLNLEELHFVQCFSFDTYILKKWLSLNENLYNTL